MAQDDPLFEHEHDDASGVDSNEPREDTSVLDRVPLTQLTPAVLIRLPGFDDVAAHTHHGRIVVR